MSAPLTSSTPAGYEESLARLVRDLDVLPDKPEETPHGTLRALWSLASGQARSLGEAADFVPEALTPEQSRALEESLERRLSGVPLAHITGRQDFMGVVLEVSCAALVPRKETELLGFHAVEKLREADDEPPLMVDVCTGAGNVALGVAVAVPAARVWGADLSEDAVALAQRNARLLRREDVAFLCGDLLDPFEEEGILGQVSVLTCNPPYISSRRVEEMPHEIRDFEPAMAFDGGAFGVGILRRLVAEAPAYLRRGGWLLTEVGAGQGPAVARLLARSDAFDEVESVRDETAEIRVVAARRSDHPASDDARS